MSEKGRIHPGAGSRGIGRGAPATNGKLRWRAASAISPSRFACRVDLVEEGSGVGGETLARHRRSRAADAAPPTWPLRDPGHRAPSLPARPQSDARSFVLRLPTLPAWIEAYIRLVVEARKYRRYSPAPPSAGVAERSRGATPAVAPRRRIYGVVPPPPSGLIVAFELASGSELPGGFLGRRAASRRRP